MFPLVREFEYSYLLELELAATRCGGGARRHRAEHELGEVAGELVPVAFDALVARSTPAKASAPRYVRVGTAGQWELFEGWRFVHHLEGDPSARRVHIVNRAMPDPLADLRQADGAQEGIPGVFGVDPVDCRRRGAPS